MFLSDDTLNLYKVILGPVGVPTLPFFLRFSDHVALGNEGENSRPCHHERQEYSYRDWPANVQLETRVKVV